MGGKVKACEECTRKCLILHGKKKDPSAISMSFFKVMMANQFSKFLFIPPKLSSTLFSLVDQETFLEDSSGQYWTVKLTIVNNKLAFHEGWATFASEHALEIGDFVMFDYIVGSHFVVKIYSTSGCEKLNFPEKKSSKRGKRSSTKLPSDKLTSDDGNSIATGGRCRTNSMNKQGSSSTIPSDSDMEIINVDKETEPTGTVNNSHCDNSYERSQLASKPEFAEIPFYMINRDSTCEQKENRSSLFDLSNFERFEETSGVAETKEVPVSEKEESPYTEKSLKPLTTPDAGRVYKDHFADERTSRTDPLDAFELGMTERRCNTEDMPKEPFTTVKDSGYSNAFRCPQIASKVDPGENEKANPEMSNCTNPICRFTKKGDAKHPMVITQKEHTPLAGSSKSALHIITGMSTMGGQNHQSAKHPMVITQKEHTPLAGSNKSAMHVITGMSTMGGQNHQSAKHPIVITQKEHTPLAGSNKNALHVITGMPNMGGQNHQSGNVWKAVKKEPSEMVQEVHGRDPKVIKSEHGEMFDHSLKDDKKPFNVVKSESVESIGLSSPNLVNFCCSIPIISQSWVELPTDWPSYSSMAKARKVLFLRDPPMRLWPVLYHETLSFRVLASGWEAFAKANNIQPGDICTFQIENETEVSFRVSISRRFEYLMFDSMTWQVQCKCLSCQLMAFAKVGGPMQTQTTSW